MTNQEWDNWARGINQKQGYGYARMSGGGFDPAFPVYDTRTETDQSTGDSKYYRRQAGTEGGWQETGNPRGTTSFNGGPQMTWEQMNPQQQAMATANNAKLKKLDASGRPVGAGGIGGGSSFALAPEVLAKMWK